MHYIWRSWVRNTWVLQNINILIIYCLFLVPWTTGHACLWSFHNCKVFGGVGWYGAKRNGCVFHPMQWGKCWKHVTNLQSWLQRKGLDKNVTRETQMKADDFEVNVSVSVDCNICFPLLMLFCLIVEIRRSRENIRLEGALRRWWVVPHWMRRRMTTFATAKAWSITWPNIIFHLMACKIMRG